VVAISAISLYFAIHGSTTLVAMLLLGYAGITQLFPGVVLGLFWKRVTLPAIFTGLGLGVGLVVFLILTKRDPYFGVSAGFLGLCANFAMAVTVSIFTSRRS